MRKLVLLTLLAVAVALPLQARGKNESYISYDDGGTIVRQGDDGREVDARVNLPVFPGDEVITNRRGRAEVRLADGNVVAIDRASAVRFRSVLDSYDSESNDTIVELKYGKVAIYRAEDAVESFRLDTTSASYFAGQEASFSVEADSHGRDHVSVFQGSIEVRTPSRNFRLRSRESANVDDRGVYSTAGDDYADDFESWFLRRAERYGAASSRYLDRSLAYYDDDLSRNGSWTFITGYGWGWRPFVSVGWRPYYHGSWIYSRGGCLTWFSYEPWGWVPYHYGRWAWDSMYGWFWMPGAAYAPAWVYWMYSPGYIGWAPAGWWDCYRPYYDWAYRPYQRAGIDFGFGFYGRVRVNDLDLRPWTFIDANTIVSTRVDRAAVSTDIVRGRLLRDTSGGYATISGNPARFSKNDLRDPAGAVNTIYRRGLTGGGGSAGTGSADMTPFFRRDSDLPGSIRDRLVRTRPAEPAAPTSTSRVSGGGSVAPIGGGSVAPIGGGSVAPIGRGGVAPIDSGRISRDPSGGSTSRDGGSFRDSGSGNTGSGVNRDSGGRINRGNDQPAERPKNDSSSDTAWRGGRVQRVAPVAPPDTTPSPRSSNPPPGATPDEWRGRVMQDSGGAPATTTPPPDTGSRSRSVNRDRGGDRGSDIPRRIIEGIGGARIYRGSEGRSSSGRDSSPPPRTSEPSRSSGGSSSPPPSRESSPPPSRDSGSSRSEGSRSEGGRIQRNH